MGGADRSMGDLDEAGQGLLLFDMTTWKWGDSYDAEAADYVQAKEIKEWYTNGLVFVAVNAGTREKCR